MGRVPFHHDTDLFHTFENSEFDDRELDVGRFEFGQNTTRQMIGHALQQAEMMRIAFTPDVFGDSGVVDGVVQTVGRVIRVFGNRQIKVEVERLWRFALVRVVPDDGLHAQAAYHDQVH